jgi:hypothetical protein
VEFWILELKNLAMKLKIALLMLALLIAVPTYAKSSKPTFSQLTAEVKSLTKQVKALKKENRTLKSSCSTDPSLLQKKIAEIDLEVLKYRTGHYDLKICKGCSSSGVQNARRMKINELEIQKAQLITNSY